MFIRWGRHPVCFSLVWEKGRAGGGRGVGRWERRGQPGFSVAQKRAMRSCGGCGQTGSGATGWGGPAAGTWCVEAKSRATFFSVALLPKLFSFSIHPMSGLLVGSTHSFQSTGRCFGSTPGLLTSGGAAAAARAVPDARDGRPCSAVGRGKWQKECKFCPKSPISEANSKTLNL